MTIEISKPELVRLLRGNPGWDADSLAEELFTLLPSLIRETPAAQLKANIDGTTPAPIQIEDFGNGTDPIINIRRGGIDFPISLSDLSSPSPTPTQPACFPGQVVSYSGGNVYVVTVYPNGTGAAGTTVSVTQLEGDPAFPHANGRWAIVAKNGSSYSMQLPVWG